MVAVVLTCVVLVAALAFYVVHRSKPSRFALKVGPPKFPLISIEVESRDDRTGHELPAKADDADTKSAS